MSHHLLNWPANLSSDTEVAVVARVAACFAGRGSLRAHLIFKFTAQGEVLSSDFLISMSNGCRSSLVQELLALRLDCSSDSASSSLVCSDLSTLADLQSGPQLHFLVIIELHWRQWWRLRVSWNSYRHYAYWQLLIREFLLLTKTLFGLAAAV